MFGTYILYEVFEKNDVREFLFNNLSKTGSFVVFQCKSFGFIVSRRSFGFIVSCKFILYYPVLNWFDSLQLIGKDPLEDCRRL